MGTPDIRPCRKCGDEYDHTRYERCPECSREYQREYQREYRKNHPMTPVARYARQGLRRALKACGVDIADIKYVNPRALLCVPSAVLAEVAGGNGYADFQDVGLEVKTQRDWLRPAQWARAILNYRNGKPYRVVRIEPIPDGRDVKTKMFETVFTFYDWQQKQAQLEREGHNGRPVPA